MPPPADRRIDRPTTAARWVATVVLIVAPMLPVQAADHPPTPETTPIDVRGKAVDAAGKPVAGATIRLISTNGIDADLATTTTDESGTYAFLKAPLPVRRHQNDDPLSGTFQVYGTAPALGFAWHGMRFYMPEPRPANRAVQGGDFSRFRDESLTMDLTFPPATTLGGRVVDGSGRPVAGAKIRLVDCDYLDTAGKEQHHNFREFWGLSQLPAALNSAITDADGRFRIAGLPKEAGFRIFIDHPDYANQSLYAATTARREDQYSYPGDQLITGVPRPAVRTGDLDLTLISTRRVIVRALLGDSGRPASNIRVSAGGYGDGPSASGTTDIAGQVTLKLPPGTYPLMADPSRGYLHYIRSKAELAVAPEPAEQTFDLRIEPGCVVILEAVDADTSKGIPAAIFMVDVPNRPNARTTVQSDASRVDHPRSGADGRLRVVTYPGQRTYSFSHVQGDLTYQAIGREKVAILPPGGEVTVRFELRKAR